MRDSVWKVAIKDTSILIDMEQAGLFDVWFQLNIETHTTDFVVTELGVDNPNARAHIKAGHIICHTLNQADILRVVELRNRHGRNLSMQDCSLLHVIGRLPGAVLLTGDMAIRRTAEERGHTVHGLLWIFDILVEQGLLHPAVAAAKLAFLCQNGCRLPREEIAKRMMDWNHSAASTPPHALPD